MKKITFALVILLASFNLVSCSSDSGDDDVIETPETFGSWSPAFTNQTSNFTQNRTGNKGTSQSRTINVTSNEISVETDENIEGEDINGDGDEVDDITLITTTYTASENLGSHTVIEYEVDLNRDLNVFNSNIGIWYSAIYFDDGSEEGIFGGYSGYRLGLDGITESYTSQDGSCYDIIDNSDGNDAFSNAETTIALNDENIYLSSTLGVDNFLDDATNALFGSTGIDRFNIYTGFEKGTLDGVDVIAYFQVWYDEDYDYTVPTVEDFLGDTEVFVDFVSEGDIYIAGYLQEIAESDLPPQCTSSKSTYPKSLQYKLLEASLKSIKH